MKLYTKKGDKGNTSLFGGSDVRKDDPRVCAYGVVDELNSLLGVVASLMADRMSAKAVTDIRGRILTIQNELFAVGAELATVAGSKQADSFIPLPADPITRLEHWIDEASDQVAPLKAFILPGGDILASQLHVCRTVCRRAERSLVALASGERVNDHILVYLNRLSDLLFAWARLVNHATGTSEQPWRHPER